MVLHHFIKSKKVKISIVVWSIILFIFMDITGGITFLYNNSIKIKSRYLYVEAKTDLDDRQWKRLYLKQKSIKIQKHVPIFLNDMYYGLINGEKYYITLDREDMKHSSFWRFLYMLQIRFNIWFIRTMIIYLILLLDLRSLIYGYLACKKTIKAGEPEESVPPKGF